MGLDGLVFKEEQRKFDREEYIGIQFYAFKGLMPARRIQEGKGEYASNQDKNLGQVLEKIKVDLDDGMRRNNIQIIVYRLEGGEPIIDFYIRKKGGGVETISVRYGEITEAYMRQLEEKIGKVYVFFKKERKVDFVGKATGHPPQ